LYRRRVKKVFPFVGRDELPLVLKFGPRGNAALPFFPFNSGIVKLLA